MPLQHTFMAAYRDLMRSGPPAAVRPWLFVIARNRCISVLRARREQPAEDLPESAIDHLASEVAAREELRAVLAGVARLPDDQRAALVLAELGDISHDEIARILDCRREQVKSYVYLARRRCSPTGRRARRRAPTSASNWRSCAARSCGARRCGGTCTPARAAASSAKRCAGSAARSGCCCRSRRASSSSARCSGPCSAAAGAPAGSASAGWPRPCSSSSRSPPGAWPSHRTPPARASVAPARATQEAPRTAEQRRAAPLAATRRRDPPRRASERRSAPQRRSLGATVPRASPSVVYRHARRRPLPERSRRKRRPTRVAARAGQDNGSAPGQSKPSSAPRRSESTPGQTQRSSTPGHNDNRARPEQAERATHPIRGRSAPRPAAATPGPLAPREQAGRAARQAGVHPARQPAIAGVRKLMGPPESPGRSGEARERG